MKQRIISLLLLLSLVLLSEAPMPRMAVAEPFCGGALNRQEAERLWNALEQTSEQAMQEGEHFQLAPRAIFTDRLAASGLPSQADWFAFPPEQGEKLVRLTGIDFLLISKVQTTRHNGLVLYLAIMNCRKGIRMPNRSLHRQYRSFAKLLASLPSLTDQLLSANSNERLLAILPPVTLNPTIPAIASKIALATLTRLLLQQQLRLAQSSDIERILRNNGIDPAQSISSQNYPLIADVLRARQLLIPQLTECTLNGGWGHVSGTLKLTDSNGELMALATFSRTLHFPTRQTPGKQMEMLYETAFNECISKLLSRMK